MECFQLGIDLHLKPCVVTYTPVIDSFARGGKGETLRSSVRCCRCPVASVASVASQARRQSGIFWQCTLAALAKKYFG